MCSCRFNWDSPAIGDGDEEDVQHILSHYQNQTLCVGGAAPTGIHCSTVDGEPWKSTGQKLSVPCSMTEGVVCLNKDNPSGCKDYKVKPV